MIQGGDPSGTGHGDYGKYPGYEFEDELNNQSHTKKELWQWQIEVQIQTVVNSL